MYKLKKWGHSQDYEEDYTLKTLGLSKSTCDDFFRKRNNRKSAWSSRLDMFEPIDTEKKVIVEVGCCVTGPIHDFSHGLKIGLEPLINKLNFWRDDSVCYIRAVGEAIPLKEECIDISISWNVLDHCMSPEKVLDEIRRVTKTSGSFFLLLNTFPRGIPRKLLELVDPTHLYHYTSREVVRLIDNFFSIVDKQKRKGVVRSGIKSVKETVSNKVVTRLFLRSIKPTTKKF